jgi:hypothetical protein
MERSGYSNYIYPCTYVESAPLPENELRASPRHTVTYLSFVLLGYPYRTRFENRRDA